MKLEAYQGIKTSGARNVCLFEINNELYAAFPQLAEDIKGLPANMNGGNSNTHALIYKWQNHQFELFQKLDICGGEHIDFKMIDDTPMLAIANIRSGKMPDFKTHIKSQVFKWQKDGFYLQQEIDTFAAKDTCFFEIENKNFLFISQGVLESKDDEGQENFNTIYHWQDDAFKPYQKLSSTWGYDSCFFEMDDKKFLAVGDNIESSKVYIWKNEQFELFQEFSKNGGGRGFCHFMIDEKHYLAFANLLHDSALYVYEENQFKKIKTFSGAGTRSFHFASIKGKHYLFKTLFITGSREAPIAKQQSTIYQWQENDFIEVGNYPTLGGTEAKTFNRDGQAYLVVSNSLSEDIRFQVDSVTYKICL